MNDQQHTPEFGKASSTKNNVTFAETDDLVAVTAQLIGGTKEVNRLYARRIVAVVNACAGISTKDLERVVNDPTPIFQLLMETTRQRDELMAFVKKVSEQEPEKPDYWSSCGQCGHNASEAEGLLEAIARAKGGDAC